jgi:FixJ family two-component response regulator
MMSDVPVVFVVDDDSEVCKALARVLASAGRVAGPSARRTSFSSTSPRMRGAAS